MLNPLPLAMLLSETQTAVQTSSPGWRDGRVTANPALSPLLTLWCVCVCAPCCRGWGRASPRPAWWASSARRTSSSRSSTKRTGDTACWEAPRSTTGRSWWLHDTHHRRGVGEEKTKLSVDMLTMNPPAWHNHQHVSSRTTTDRSCALCHIVLFPRQRCK